MAEQNWDLSKFLARALALTFAVSFSHVIRLFSEDMTFEHVEARAFDSHKGWTRTSYKG